MAFSLSPTCSVLRVNSPLSIYQLGGMKRDPELTFTLRPKLSRESLHGSESEESSTPRKLRKTLSALGRAIEVPANPWDDEARNATTSISPETPPIISYRTSRRKGIPHRAPF